MAQFLFNQLASKTAQLEAVKEQILIRYIGCGWKEAYHAWSLNERPYTADELFQHFIETVLPLADILEVPDEAPLNLPALPDMPKVGTTSCLAKALEKGSNDMREEIKAKARETKRKREEEGKGDRYYEEQLSIPPPFETPANRHINIKKMKVGFKIEVAYEYTGHDGSKSLGWYQGKVSEIVNKEKMSVKIKWNKECLGVHDKCTSIFKLVPRNYNPKVIRKNGWREYLT